MRKSLINPQAGFNRIEVIVLTLVIIIVVTGFLFFITETQKTIRDAVRKGHIESIARGLETHFNRFKDQFCLGAAADSYCQVQADWFSNDKIPRDPLSEDYLNLPKDGDKKYTVCAKLESDSGNAGDSKGKPGSQRTYYCQSSQQ